MLILMRHPGEGITLKIPGQGDIHIQVLMADNGQTSLGFDADDHVVIMRDELLEGPDGLAGVAKVRRKWGRSVPQGAAFSRRGERPQGPRKRGDRLADAAEDVGD